jgi:predicted ATPase
MSAAEIAERLDDGHLLARAARTAQPRHQSLAAAIDWSYKLLTSRSSGSSRGCRCSRAVPTSPRCTLSAASPARRRPSR